MPNTRSYASAELRAQQARRAGLEATREEQPLNTARSYASKQREWREWCLKPRDVFGDGKLTVWPDGELVTPDKLAAWLNEDILLRRVNPRGQGWRRRRLQHSGPDQGSDMALREAENLAKDLDVPLHEAVRVLVEDREDYKPPDLPESATGDEKGSLYTRSTIDAYIAAIIELWRVQVAHGSRNTENPRGAAVRGFLKQRSHQRLRIERAEFKDRGLYGIQAGYSDSEWIAIQEHLLRESGSQSQALRTRIDLLFGHYYLLRGENRRKMELADLSLLTYPDSEGPSQCNCLVALLQDGKLNKTAKKEFMGSIRHKNPLLCTQGALAQLFFWRWHISGEAPPTFRHRQDWYNIKVLVGQNREQELSYTTQLQETWKIFGAVGLTTAKKTHLPRCAGAQSAEIHGTSLAQITQAGRWNQSVLCQAYLTHLPREFMKIVSGFSRSQGDYFLARALFEPPSSLQSKIWPWIEEWEARFDARARRQRWEQGGLDDDDLAGDGFLKLMRYLRAVLLQDLAILQPQFPELPFFRHQPFYGPDWDTYAVSVQTAVRETPDPPSLLLQRALPELCTILENMRANLLASHQRTSQWLFTQLANRLASQEDRTARKIESLRSNITISGVANIVLPDGGTVVGGPLPGAALAPAVVPVSGPEPGPGPAFVWQAPLSTAVSTALTATATAPAPPLQWVPSAPPDGSMPRVTSLTTVYTVEDLWRQWKDGLPGEPGPVRDLEDRYGSRWRPDNKVRVQFCRRKVVWDEVLRLIRSGKSEEEALRAVEALRAGQSLNRLIDMLKKRPRRQ
jgi:hypothetical protein